MNYKWLYALFIVFVQLVENRFGQILGQDEISHYYKAGRILFQELYAHPDTIITFSPHLYPLSILGVCRLLQSFNPTAVQVTGIIYWLLCLLVMWRIGKNFHERMVSCLLCVFMPVIVQSAVIIEIDQTVLPLLTLLVCASAEHFCDWMKFRRGVLVALCFALALWGRLTTPLVLVPLLVVYAGLRTGKWQSSAWMALALTCGFLLFLGTWIAYGQLTGIHWRGVFTYLFTSFQETTVGERASGISRVLQTWMYMMFWGVNPILLLLTAMGLGTIVKQWLQNRCLPEDSVYLLAAAWLIVGYSIVGGALFGFPKYQIPAIPLLCLGVGIFSNRYWLTEHNSWKQLMVLAGIVIVTAVLVAWAGDPLYAMRVSVRDALAEGRTDAWKELVSPLSKQVVLWCILFAVMMVAWKKGNWPIIPLMLLMTLTVNSVFTFQQPRKGYCTGYIYGDEGETEALGELIRRRGWRKEQIMIPHEALFQTGNFSLVNDKPETWGDAMLKAIMEKRPQMVAVSVLCNPVNHVHEMLNHEKLQEYFKRYYNFKKFGRYYVWTRKNPEEFIVPFSQYSMIL